MTLIQIARGIFPIKVIIQMQRQNLPCQLKERGIVHFKYRNTQLLQKKVLTYYPIA